jgi:hypothetical protein
MTSERYSTKYHVSTDGKAMIETETPPSPPISPENYHFTLPSNSPLAASIAISPEKTQPTKAPSPARLQARLNLASLGRSRPFPLYTRSAEPSPVKTTFSGLDQSRPPPEFVPRATSEIVRVASPSELLRKQATSPAVPAPSRHTARFPSLAQIQAKMNRAGHRRGNSIGSSRDLATRPSHIALPAAARLKLVHRTASDDSVEVLKTPTDEQPPARPRIIFDSPERRAATPPSPTASAKESRLAPFLRERTSGRLKTRPVSMPPLSGFDVNVFAFNAPTVTVTPPKSKTTAATVPPPSPSRAIVLNTPPAADMKGPSYSSPGSPTDSVRSRSSVASPTLSVPIITCTPAPTRFVQDGVEHDSDEEGSQVVLFEGELADEELPERERRAREMLERLTLRRRSG